MSNKSKTSAFWSRLSKRTVWIVLIILVLAGGGGYTYYHYVYLPAQTPAQPALQTAVVRQGDLTLSASGTGTLTPAAQATFGFRTSGQVTKINVKVGDTVEAGQIMAELDNTSQQIQYTQAKRALADLTSPYAIATAENDVATAQQAVVTATSHLAYLISPNVLYWEGEVAKAQQALTDAQSAAKSSPSTTADANVKKAQETLSYLQDKLTGAWDYWTNTYVPQNFTYHDRATGKEYVALPKDSDIALARAEVAQAQAQVVEAQNYLAALKGESVPADATGTNLNTLEDAQLALQTAEDNLKATQLIAPISGTVMSVDFNLGDAVSSGTGVTIDDLSQPYLEIFLDATDWSNIAVGYAVNVTFDALPSQTFTGKVTEVDPGLYTSGNTSAVRGIVLLDQPSSKVNLPIGSTASVDVIAAQAKNAVLVPVSALHEYAPGKYSVFVDKNGTLTVQNVEIGIKDLVNAEVKSGLQPGEMVSTGITETKQ